jgi:hypothetical protein
MYLYEKSHSPIEEDGSLKFKIIKKPKNYIKKPIPFLLVNWLII